MWERVLPSGRVLAMIPRKEELEAILYDQKHLRGEHNGILSTEARLRHEQLILKASMITLMISALGTHSLILINIP